MRFEAAETVLPELAHGAHPFLAFAQLGRLERQNARLGGGAANEARLLQNLEMIGDRGAAHVETRGNVAHLRLAAGELGQDGAAHGMRAIDFLIAGRLIPCFTPPLNEVNWIKGRWPSMTRPPEEGPAPTFSPTTPVLGLTWLSRISGRRAD
jgi:hypothetical protein